MNLKLLLQKVCLKGKIYIYTDEEKSQMMMSLVNRMQSGLVEQSDVRYFLFTVLHVHSWKLSNNTIVTWKMPCRGVRKLHNLDLAQPPAAL